jgi:signal transduction histidine kinase
MVNQEPQNNGYFGLASRYLLHLAVVGLILSLLLVWNMSSRQNRIIFHEMEQRGVLLGESLAGACSLPYLLGDMKTVNYILGQAQEIQDVAYISLLDPKGNPVLALSGAPANKRNPLRNNRLIRKVEGWTEGDAMFVQAPLMIRRQKGAGIIDMISDDAPSAQIQAAAEGDNILGSILIQLSLQRTEQLTKSLVMQSMAATAAILLVGCIAVFLFFQRTISNPLQKLIKAMRRVREGDLTQEIEGPFAQHEIGSLTQSFNEMTHDLKTAQMELRNINTELESRVSERTHELENSYRELHNTQEKVIRTQKLAAIGQLASGVSHELRNPLGAISNAIYYVKDSLKDHAILIEDPTLKEILVLAENETKNMNRIIKDLLDFSREQKLDVESTDVNRLLKEMRPVLEVPENISLVENFKEDLPPAEIDAQRMRQVFLNMAQNAIQSMPMGGKLIITTGHLLDQQELDFITVSFRDTGVGMDPDTLQKAFEPLFTTKARGTGLGLPICLGIVEKHGGKILVESEPNKGTTFTIQFPLRRQVK